MTSLRISLGKEEKTIKKKECALDPSPCRNVVEKQKDLAQVKELGKLGSKSGEPPRNDNGDGVSWKPP